MSAMRAWLCGASMACAFAGAQCAWPVVAQTRSVRTDAAQAQPGNAAKEAGRGAGTGDAWVDARLPEIDLYGRRYQDAFADELARYHGTPRAFTLRLLDHYAWPAGEVYYACALAAVVGRPCSDVIARRAVARDAPWQDIATRFDAAPGTRAAARLKRGIVASHARWGRPLVLDAELARAAAKAAADKAQARKPAR